MNLQQVIESIAELGRKASVNFDVVGELALVFAWQHVAEYQPEKGFPNPNAVSNGELTLADTYQRIDSLIGSSFSGFARSELPRILSADDAVQLIRNVQKVTIGSTSDLVSMLHSKASSNAKHSGSFTLPENMVQLMIGLSELQGGDVYAPYTSSVQLAVAAQSNAREVTFQAEGLSMLAEASLLLANIDLFNEEPLIYPILDGVRDKRLFSNVVMVPPFGRRIKGGSLERLVNASQQNVNGDVLALENALSQCSGRLVAVVPQGFLFRGAFDHDLRVKLVNTGILEAVINLPSPVFAQTGLAVAVLVIDKRRDVSQPVIFFDADNPEFFESGGRGQPLVLSGFKKVQEDVLARKETSSSKLISQAEIKDNKYDLSVKRYVLGQASASMRALTNTRTLADIADLIRGQLLKQDDSALGDLFYEVGVKDIGEDGFISSPDKGLLLSGRMKDRAELQQLQPGDVLLVTKGSVGRVGIVGPDCGENWVASQSFQVVRLTGRHIIESPEYLYMYLSSKLVNTYLLEQVTGTTIPVLKTADVKNLPVPILDRTEQQKIVETRTQMLGLYEEIQAKKQQIDALHSDHWSL